jgi:hypothetical protein
MGRHEKTTGGRSDDRRLAVEEQFDAAGTLGLGGKVLGVRLLEKYLDLRPTPGPGNVVSDHAESAVCMGCMAQQVRRLQQEPLTGVWLECYCGGTFGRTLTETGGTAWS